MMIAGTDSPTNTASTNSGSKPGALVNQGCKGFCGKYNCLKKKRNLQNILVVDRAATLYEC